MLKRDSEVIMPGDPGYIPFAIISRQPEKQEANVPASEAQSQATAKLQEALVQFPSEQLDSHSDKPDVKSDEPVPDNFSAAEAPAAAAIASKPSQLSDAAAHTSDAAYDSSRAVEGEERRYGKETALKSPIDNDERKTVSDKKSLRDTIVRRTIIIPADVDFENLRARSASLLSSNVGQGRKTRRFVPSHMDSMPMSRSASRLAADADGSAAAGTVDESRTPKAAEHQLAEAIELPLSTGSVSRPQVQSVEGAVVEESMPTTSSQQSLRPERTPDTTRSNRTSRAESSYAGSLYDMYIGPDGDAVANKNDAAATTMNDTDSADQPCTDRSYDESANAGEGLTPLSVAGRSSRASRQPTPHLEVTERADGSVVWQVIAGLADHRSSVYSEYSSRRSDYGDDTGLDSANSSNLSGGGKTGVDQFADNNDIAAVTAGNEESRALFTKRQPKATVVIPHTATTDHLPLSTSPEKVTAETQRDVTSSSQHTRIVYHNDAQLASLLDVLAHGKDSAKFELQFSPNAAGADSHTVHTADYEFPRSTSNSFDAHDGDNNSARGNSTSDHQAVLDAHRSRVEAEIYTLLNQRLPLITPR